MPNGDVSGGPPQLGETTVMSLADRGLRQISDRWMWVRCKGKIRHATVRIQICELPPSS